MNCRHVQSHLAAYQAGRLGTWRRRRVAAHLKTCAECRTELSRSERLDSILHQWTVAVNPRSGFDQRVWNRIRAAEQERPVLGWWQRPGWVLGLASATAALMLVTTGGLIHQRTDASAKNQIYASLGLDRFGDTPDGSITDNYINLASR